MPVHNPITPSYLRTSRTPRAAGCAAAIAGLAASAAAQTQIMSVPVATGLTGALGLATPPRDFHRVFVLEVAGRIRIVKDGVLLPTPFLNIQPLVNSTTWLEWGLLGLAFHPDYASNGYFYVNYIDQTGATVIARYSVSTADPDLADPASAQIVLTITHTNREHRAGWLAFGPDGYLYDSQGDGGPEGDPMNKGQNLNVLDGKMLRIDVNGDDFPADPLRNYAIPPGNPFAGPSEGLDEIWAYGLRNPWRWSFDRLTGDLWIGDVGQSTREEVDFQPVIAAGGRNYGWPCTEGTSCFLTTACTCNGPGLTPPIYDYGRTQGGSVTGGYIYRGCAMPDFQGLYFFGDYAAIKVWTMRRIGTGIAEFIDRTGAMSLPGNPRAFGEDGYGELYIVTASQVRKIGPVTPVGPDCNSNGIRDTCDILSGFSHDVNQNGIPDECENLCYPNCDGSTIAPVLNVSDFICFGGRFAAGDSYANCDGSTSAPILNINDFICFQGRFAAGCR